MSAKRGNVAAPLRSAPQGRTTSPPAPRVRGGANSQPQPSRLSAAGAAAPPEPDPDDGGGGSGRWGASAAAPGPRPPRHPPAGLGRPAAAPRDGAAGWLGWGGGDGRHVDPGGGLRGLRGRDDHVDVEMKVGQYVQNTSVLPGADGAEEEYAPITCLAFDATGEHFAYGDRTGRCYVFERVGRRLAPLTHRAEAETPPHMAQNGYRLIDVIEAYQPQLDTLNSMEIEARVNVVRFVKRGTGAVFFLSANDKTIKLWKVWERARGVVDPGYDPTQVLLEGWKELKMPTVRQVDRGVWHKEAKVFAADHEYHVNSISPSSNTDNFITADDLTVHLWDLAHHEQSLRVVDRKPEHMEDLSETITACTFHPKDPCTFCVASSKGILTIYDLRQNLTLRAPARVLPGGHGPPMSAPNVYLSSILAGISHVQYSPCGTYLAARDYMSVKIWDARREATPVKEFRVHDHLQPRVTELYETDCMFDRFELAYNPSGRQLFSGSYRSEIAQFAVETGESRLYQHIDGDLFQPRPGPLRGQGGVAPPPPKPHEEEDFKKKALHVAAHPNDDIVAVASGHELYLHVRPDAAAAAASGAA